MRTYFADTWYYRALFNPRDEHHERVAQWTKGKRYRTVTTEFVLTEVGDEFCRSPLRRVYEELVAQLCSQPTVRIVPASHDLYDAAIQHFGQRPDKDWGMTDCTSFVVMGQEGLHEALTADHHFEQAGFTALLK